MLNADVLDIDKQESARLATNLTALLKKKHLTASKLAQDLNLPVMTIRRLMFGETTDPRLSTLKMLADYFHISIDALTGEIEYQKSQYQVGSKPNFVPVLSWEIVEKMHSITEIDLSEWTEWQPISSTPNNPIGKNSFALVSRPSMSPRFPHGTVFVFDPDATPRDGDLILVKIENAKELTLRELVIDPPEWYLQSVISGSGLLGYSPDVHKILGVNIMTLLYNRRAID